MKASGRDSDAAAARAMYSVILQTLQVAQFVMQGASSAQVDAYARLIEQSVDWEYVEEYNNSIGAVDMLTAGVAVDVPTLFLQTPLQMPADAADVLGQFCSRLSVASLDFWSTQMHRPEAAAELGDKVIDFAKSVGAGAR